MYVWHGYCQSIIVKLVLVLPLLTEVSSSGLLDKVLMGLRQPSWLPDIFTTYAESLRRTIRPSGRQSPSLQLGRQYDAMIVRSGSGGSCRLAHVYKYESPFAEVDSGGMLESLCRPNAKNNPSPLCLLPELENDIRSFLSPLGVDRLTTTLDKRYA